MAKFCECGRPATALCDWALNEDDTCDRPICPDHVQFVDYRRRPLCPEHWSRWKALIKYDSKQGQLFSEAS